MAEIPFYQTRMGRQYYESTAPELVRQLTRLNELLERIAKPTGNRLNDSEKTEEDQPR